MSLGRINISARAGNFDGLNLRNLDALRNLDLPNLRNIDLTSLRNLDLPNLRNLDTEGLRNLDLNPRQLAALDALSDINIRSLNLDRINPPTTRNLGRNLGLAALGVAIVDQIAFGGSLIAKVFGFGGKATEETIKFAFRMVWNAIDSFMTIIFGKQWKYFVFGFIILVAVLYIYRLIRK